MTTLQIFQHYTRDRGSQVLKIDKSHNCTADTLARLAFSSPDLQHQDYVPSYSYEHLDQ
jgi:hypothetical protein